MEGAVPNLANLLAEVFSVREVAQLLKLSVAAVYELCRTGSLGHYRFGTGRGTIRITGADVEGFLQKSRRELEKREKSRQQRSKELRLRPLKHIELRDMETDTKSG